MKLLNVFMVLTCIFTQINGSFITSLFNRQFSQPVSDIDKQLTQELKIVSLNYQVLQQTIMALLSKDYEKFDAIVGDNKCQTRTSMLLDYESKFSQQQEELQLYLRQLREKQTVAEDSLASLPKLTHLARRDLTEQLKQTTLQATLERYCLGLTAAVPQELKTAAQCFALDPTNRVFETTILTRSALQEMQKDLKRQLKEQSIAYERMLAAQYSGPDVQQALTYATTGQNAATGFFPGIIPVLAKMVARRQPIMVNKDMYCADCSKFMYRSTACFTSDGTRFQKTPQLPGDQVAMMIDGNQYPGSLAQLKEKLGVSPEATYIPTAYKQKCCCAIPLDQPPFPDDIVETILNNAAEHEQFVGGGPMPFSEIGLTGSTLERDYTQRMNPKGFGIANMSCFSIDHICPKLPTRL